MALKELHYSPHCVIEPLQEGLGHTCSPKQVEGLRRENEFIWLEVFHMSLPWLGPHHPSERGVRGQQSQGTGWGSARPPSNPTASLLMILPPCPAH